MRSDSSSQPLTGSPGQLLFSAAVVIAIALRFTASGRLAFGWAGFVVAVVGAVYFVHPARVTIAQTRSAR